MWIRAILGLLLALPLPAAEVWKAEPADVPELRRGAEQGDPAALADLAFLSRYARDGVAWDAAMIFDYSRRSAEAGDAFGMANLSYCHMNGCGTAFDAEQAHRWAKQSADLGHPSGIARLAICIDKGWGEAKDPGRSFQLVEKAAAAGGIEAKVLVASDYWDGSGTRQDRARCIALNHELVREFNWCLAAVNALFRVKELEKPVRHAEEEADFHSCLAEHRQMGLPDAEYYYAHMNRHRIPDEDFISLLVSAARKGHRLATLNLANYLRTRVSEDYDFPLYGAEETLMGLSRSSYEAGARAGANHASRAAWDYCARCKEDPANLPKALAIAQEWVLDGHRSFHFDAAAAYYFGMIHDIEEFEQPELVEAHVIYNRDPDDLFLINALVWVYLDKHPRNEEDLARGYLTTKRGIDLGSDYIKQHNSLAFFEAKMVEKDHELVRKLEKEDFPTGERFVKEARERILASGFQLPPEDRPTK